MAYPISTWSAAIKNPPGLWSLFTTAATRIAMLVCRTSCTAGDRSPSCLAKLQEIADNLGECDSCGRRFPFEDLATYMVPGTGEGQFCVRCRGGDPDDAVR